MSTSNISSVSTIFSEDAKWILPDNVIQKILLGLPAIDLVLLKGVCKYWRSLISSADFAAAHLNRSNSDSSRHCLIVHNDIPLALGLPPPGPFKSFICLTVRSKIVVGSVNGLICLAGTSSSYGLFPPNIVVIFNPSTGLSTKLPPPSKYHLRTECHMVKFAFWCLDGVYKVAKIYSNSYCFGSHMRIDGEVWDSTTDTWSPITPILGMCISKRLPWVSAPDVLIEQEFAASAYWIANCYDDLFVLSLNLKTLVLDSISVSQIQDLLTPECHSLVLNYKNTSMFGASIDGNFVFLHKNLSNDCIYDVWTMDLDGQGVWNKNSKIQFNFPFSECLNCVNGKLILRGKDSLAIYDMKTVTKDVFEFKSVSATSAHDFVGSLVSIQGFEYNVQPNADIDASWPYSCGSANSERRTGRAAKNALKGIYRCEWNLILEQQERISERKSRKSCSDEWEGKVKELRVQKKRIQFLEQVFMTWSKEIENLRKVNEDSRKKIVILSKEIEKMKMEMSTLQSDREEKENVLVGHNVEKTNALIEGLQLGVWVGGSSVAAVALFGVVCYIQLRKVPC